MIFKNLGVNIRRRFLFLVENYNRNSVMFKILISYLVLTFLLCSFVPFILMKHFSKKYISSIKSSASDSINQSNSTANALITSIYGEFFIKNNTDFIYTKALYNHDFDSYEKYDICQQLENDVSLQNNILSSIYIYNFNSNRVFTSGQFSNYIDGFYDEDCTKVLKNLNKYKNRMYVARKFQNKDLISIFYKNFSNEGKLQSALILNIDASKLKNLLIKHSNSSLNNIYIIDNQGFILLDSSNESRNFIKNKNMVQTILSSTDVENNFISKANNKNKLVMYIKSKDIGWNFINIVDLNMLLSDLNAIRIYSLCISVIFVAVSLIFIVLCLKSIYNPFYKLMKTLKSKNEQNVSSNEFEYLENVFLKLNTNIENLKNNEIALKSSRKYALLIEVISKDFKLNPKLKEEMLSLKMNVVAKNYVVAVYTIDSTENLRNNYSSADKDIIKYAILNIIDDILSINYQAQSFFDTNNIVSIICLDSNSEGVKDALTTSIKNIQNYIVKYLKLSVTCSLGNIVKHIDLISSSYGNAVRFLNYKLITGDNSIIDYYKFKVQDGTHINYPYKIEKEILLDIKNKKDDELENYIKDFFIDIKDTAFYEIQTYIGQLIISIDKFIKASNSIELSKNVDFNFSDVYMQCFYLSTLSEIEALVIQKLKVLTKSLSTNKDIKNQKIADKIVEYISKNYPDPNLSVDTISEYIGLSCNYVREIFKEMENKSLSKYINEFRMEKAIEFFKNTDYTAKKIASLVGFNDNRHFYGMFKKYTNFTTEEFKQNCKL